MIRDDGAISILFKSRRSGESTVEDLLLPSTIDFVRLLERLTNSHGVEVGGFAYWNQAEQKNVKVLDKETFKACVTELMDVCEAHDLPEALVDITVIPRSEIPTAVRADATASAVSAKSGAGGGGAEPARHRSKEYLEMRAAERLKRIDAISLMFNDAASGIAMGVGGRVSSADQWSREHPLHAAAQSRATDAVAVVRSFVEKGGLGKHASEVIVNERDSQGRTPLHYAAGRGRADVVSYLIDAGGDATMADASGQTPLHKAASGGHALVVRALVVARCDANQAETVGGRTPLMLAAKGGHGDCVSVMLRFGAKCEIRCYEGKCAWDYAPAAGNAPLRAMLSGGTPNSALEIGADAVRGGSGGTPKGGEESVAAYRERVCSMVRGALKALEGADVELAGGRGGGQQVLRELARVEETAVALERAVQSLSKLQAITLQM